MSDKMYVWEVREDGGECEGIYWRYLFRCDDEALSKIKKVLIENLNNSYDWDLTAKSQIAVVVNLSGLSDGLVFEKKYSVLEVKKIEVI